MQDTTALYAFENTWHVIALIGTLVVARLSVSYLKALRIHRAAVVEFIDSALIAVLLVFCILRPFVIQAFFIPSTSMEDTLKVQDRILVSKFIYYFRDPEVGDIIVFDAPEQALQGQEGHKDFIKRVVGVPGDRIAVKDFKLYRNGAPVDEPYIKETPWYTWPPGAEEGEEVVVPEGKLLVCGDNRNNSNDSTKWRLNGQSSPFLPRQNVLGKAMVIFWPPRRVGLLH